MRRQLGMSLVVQSIGAASVFFATAWLGVNLGPEQQGSFSRTKAEIEFITVVAMFGLPQALFYFMKSSRLSGCAALRWAVFSALLAFPVGALYLKLYEPPPSSMHIVAFAAAVGFGVLHGQLRPLLLVDKNTAWFNLVTSLPQFLVMTGVVVLVNYGAVSNTLWPWVFALAFGTAAAVAWWRFVILWPRSSSSLADVGTAEICRYGFAAWLTAGLYTAATLLMQRWVESSQGLVALGLYTMAMTLVQVPLTPINYAAPLLFRRWMEQPASKNPQRLAGLLFAGGVALAALIWLAASVWPHLGFGEAYAGLTRVVAVLVLGGSAEAVSRILGVAANAHGSPRINVYAEIARWTVLALGWMLPVPVDLLFLCALWSVSCLACAAMFWSYSSNRWNQQAGVQA